MEGLTQKTDQRLQEISGQVEKRLTEGFEKTTATFGDILKRLALIDEAQKKITELSSNVVSLQEILADKRSRGAFGEVQLHSLVRNVLAEANYELQYTLPNGKIADCVLLLPEPTGMVVIDSSRDLRASPGSGLLGITGGTATNTLRAQYQIRTTSGRGPQVSTGVAAKRHDQHPETGGRTSHT